MKLNFLFIALLLGTAFIMNSCGDDEEPMEECETTDLTYTNYAASILNASCATSNCHADGNEGFARFSLEGYANTSAAVSFGRIVGAINHDDGFLPMPYPIGSEKLDQCDIDKLTAWINDGAPE